MLKYDNIYTHNVVDRVQLKDDNVILACGQVNHLAFFKNQWRMDFYFRQLTRLKGIVQNAFYRCHIFSSRNYKLGASN